MGITATKKMGILKRKNKLGDIYYDCIDDKRQKVIAIFRPKHNTFCVSNLVCVLFILMIVKQ